MKLLLPLGLLGLLGILALILIYILRPNYQQKLISSTFIWRLSLKFRKRKIPFNRLRNILLVICQVAVICLAAMILSNPVQILREKITQPEVVLVIDSSASMRTENDQGTRYERAIKSAIEEANRTFDRDGIVSVIIASDKNTYLVERAGATNRDTVIDEMDALLDEDTQCSYGSADLQAAVAKSDDVLQVNPSAKVYLYTDTTYASIPDTVGYVNVSDTEEWNAAILNAYAEMEDNYFTFYVDVVCYGRDYDLNVTLEVFGLNAENSEDTSKGTLTLEETVPCVGDQVTRLIFKYVPSDEEDEYINTLPDNTVFHNITESGSIYSYQSVHISIDEEDSLTLDNQYDIYGGLKQLIKVEYFSAGQDPSTGAQLSPNIFFQEVLAALKKTYADRWDIQIKQIKLGDPYEATGYDFYIFEHQMPDEIPTDGVVLLVDPIDVPASAGVRYGGILDMSKNNVFLAEEQPHEILKGMTPSNISVSRYVRLTSYDPAFSVLLSYAGDPMLLVRNDETARLAILSFSLHYSNLAMLIDFPLLIDHLFHYYLPATVIGNSFETGTEVSFNCQGNELNVKGYNTDIKLTEFPAKLSFGIPGSYTLSQDTYSGKYLEEKVYIKMPRAESNIRATGESIESPYYEVDESDYYKDLLLYLAIALVAFLTAEWYLQHKESSI